MDSHEALYFLMNPQELLEKPTEIVDPDSDVDEEPIPLIGMMSGSDEPLIPEGEQLESVIAECIDFLGEQGAETDTFGPDRVKAAEVYGSTEQMFKDFQKLLEGEADA
jgi:hypothetical protein